MSMKFCVDYSTKIFVALCHKMWEFRAKYFIQITPALKELNELTPTTSGKKNDQKKIPRDGHITH